MPAPRASGWRGSLDLQPLAQGSESLTASPISPQNLLRRDLYPLLEAAGLPRVRFHDLRHTLATLLLGRGGAPQGRQ
jgi:integrase